MSFTLATFNVRDLFDDTPPNVVGGLDAARTWTNDLQTRATRIYEARLETLAVVLRRMNADVVALQEIKNERVLKDLCARVGGRSGQPNGGYTSMIAGIAGNRGIACGLISRFPVVECSHRVPEVPFVPGFTVGQRQAISPIEMPRRGVIDAQIELPDRTRLHLLVLHFKSHLPQGRLRSDGSVEPARSMRDYAEGVVRSEVLRTAEALAVRERIDAILDLSHDAQIAVAGDFNDAPDSVTLRAITGDLDWNERLEYDGRNTLSRGRAMFSCADAIPGSQRFSVYARGRPVQIDHVVCSRALWSRFQRARFLNETLYHDQAQSGPNALASDHAPLVAEFT